jgi:hypothetical protein
VVSALVNQRQYGITRPYASRVRFWPVNSGRRSETSRKHKTFRFLPQRMGSSSKRMNHTSPSLSDTEDNQDDFQRRDDSISIGFNTRIMKKNHLDQDVLYYHRGGARRRQLRFTYSAPPPPPAASKEKASPRNGKLRNHSDECNTGANEDVSSGTSGPNTIDESSLSN